MTMKIASLFAVLALLGGAFANCVSANPSDATPSSIKLSLFPSSNDWWVAVDPTGDGNATAKMELQESSSSVWAEMISNPSWGYFQLASNDGNGFDLPLSFRLTSSAGEQLVLSKVLGSLGGALIDSAQQFQGNGGHANPTQPSNPTSAPTQRATFAPTHAPTQHATPAPTHAPTQHATPAPTHAPTQHATPAPTTRPTSSGGSSSSGSSTNLCTVTPTSTEPLKVMVPLYVEPGKQWDELITAAATGVKIMAIINPSDGPVSSGPSSSYKTYMQKFTAAGIEMVGYVHTGWGSRSISDVEADVSTYASKYPGLTGIFVDEASAEKADLSYYTSLYSSIQSHSGYSNTILNPGTMPDEGYLNAGTNIMVFESGASGFKGSRFSNWVSCAPSAAAKANYKYKFSAIAIGVTASNVVSMVDSMRDAGIGYVYMTDDTSSCCTYNQLTSYFPALAAAAKSA